MDYNNDLLDSLRFEGDPIIDTLMEQLFQNGLIAEVNDVLKYLINNDDPIPERLSNDIKLWLRDNSTLPAWVDMQRIHNANLLFRKHGLTISLILSTVSLVSCFAAQKGAKVLAFSNKMEENSYRRLNETKQFVLLIMEPNGLVSGGQGIRAIQKVRLMHAAIRLLINKSGRWPKQDLGVPICQEDMLGTLTAFSYVPILAMRDLGIIITEQQADDYIYFWKVVGEILGIRSDIIPCTFNQSKIAMELIAKRHHGSSPEGIQLTKSLLEMYADFLPGKVFNGIIPSLIRNLAGDQIADWMEVPKSRWDRIIKYKKFGNILNSDFLGGIIHKFGLSLLNLQVEPMNESSFKIPRELREAWDVKKVSN